MHQSGLTFDVVFTASDMKDGRKIGGARCFLTMVGLLPYEDWTSSALEKAAFPLQRQVQSLGVFLDPALSLEAQEASVTRSTFYLLPAANGATATAIPRPREPDRSSGTGDFKTR